MPTHRYLMPDRLIWILRDAQAPLRFKSLCIRCGAHPSSREAAHKRSTVSMALRELCKEGSVQRIAHGVYQLAPPPGP